MLNFRTRSQSQIPPQRMTPTLTRTKMTMMWNRMRKPDEQVFYFVVWFRSSQLVQPSKYVVLNARSRFLPHLILQSWMTLNFLRRRKFPPQRMTLRTRIVHI